VAGGGAAVARADVAAQALAAAEGRASRTRSDTDTDTGRRRRARSDDAGPARGRSGSRWGASTELDPDADPVAVAREICLRLLTDRSRTRKELAQALRRRGVPDDAADTVLERFDEVGLIDDAAFAGQWVRSRHTGSRGLGRRALAVELRRKGVADDVAERVLGRYTEVGLIDDAAFAQAWVQSRHAGRGLARRALAAELRQRGVADDTVKEAVEELAPEQEESAARELVAKRMAATRGMDPVKRTRRIVGVLARKGYSGGLAYRVVRDALEEEGIGDLPDSPPEE
jgi:regulatory protein